MTARIGAVVEGHGEVQAIPVLVRRICHEHGIFDVKVIKPHRLPRSEMTREKVSAAVRLQQMRIGAQGVVIVLYDADDDDPVEVRRRTLEILGDARAVVAVAVREYEAWFLAGMEGLRQHQNVKDDAEFSGNPESPRNPKKVLEEMMNESYRETLHQARFSAEMNLSQVRRRSRSYAAFENELVAALR